MDVSGQLHAPAALSAVRNPRHAGLDTWEDENFIEPA